MALQPGRSGICLVIVAAVEAGAVAGVAQEEVLEDLAAEVLVAVEQAEAGKETKIKSLKAILWV